MEIITIDELQKDFDSILDRVDSGESFLITSPKGNLVMTPYNEYHQVEDDLIRIHTDHEEGC